MVNTRFEIVFLNKDKAWGSISRPIMKMKIDRIRNSNVSCILFIMLFQIIGNFFRRTHDYDLCINIEATISLNWIPSLPWMFVFIFALFGCCISFVQNQALYHNNKLKLCPIYDNNTRFHNISYLKAAVTVHSAMYCNRSPAQKTTQP